MGRGLLLLCVAACGDNTAPPPVTLHAGRLVAEIASEPPQIRLLLDGREVWATRAGAGADGHEPPHGFAATGTLARGDIRELAGMFDFNDMPDADTWHPVTRLDQIENSADRATFVLLGDAGAIGTGELALLADTRSGPDPGAAGFPQHVRIHLVAGGAERISLAATAGTDEHFVGLGGQSFDVDHHGETVPLWVQEDGIGKFPDPDEGGSLSLSGRKHTTHTPMPMVLSSRGYAIALDTNARAVFALGSEQPDTARFEAQTSALDLQIFIGDPPAASRDALGQMLAWTGKPERPPLATFAPWVDAVFGSANVRRVAQALRANGISASAIWTEDWRGGADAAETPPGYAITENWHLDPTLYPDFATLATDLHADGYAFLVYQNTFVNDAADIYAEATTAGYTIRDPAGGGPYEFTSNSLGTNSSMLDLSNPAAVAWATGIMTEPLTLGADGWMADFGEWLPVDAVLASGEPAIEAHNRYPVDWARFNHDLFGARPRLYFMRSAWLHSQPLVQVIWPGDQQTSFEDGDGLPSVVPMAINLGLAGFPYFGSDIAGYMSIMSADGTTTAELFDRWTTFGALQPVMRTHHGRSARQNVQWDHDAQTIAQFRRWARLHMQLAPYHWGLIGSFERDGLPLVRMIALAYPDEDWAWTTIDEYLLGDRILVAPVVTAGATARDVQLPAGTWYPLLGGTAVTGAITADAPLTEIPAFVPAGALLVLYPDGVDTVLPAKPGTVTAGNDREVWLFPGAADDPSRATWNDELGVAGPPQWTWSGRPDGPPATTATFGGAAVTIANATVTVTGDGTLAFGDGSSLVIARGDPAAKTIVRLR